MNIQLTKIPWDVKLFAVAYAVQLILSLEYFGYFHGDHVFFFFTILILLVVGLVFSYLYKKSFRGWIFFLIGGLLLVWVEPYFMYLKGKEEWKQMTQQLILKNQNLDFINRSKNGPVKPEGDKGPSNTQSQTGDTP